MPLKKYLTVFFLSAFLSCGCVSTVSDPLFSNTGPIIDRKGVDLNLYALDLKQCNEYAAQVSVGRSVLKGAAAGAAIGGLYEGRKSLRGGCYHRRHQIRDSLSESEKKDR